MKKKDKKFTPEESISVKRQRLKETYIMEAIFFSIASMWILLNYSAYAHMHPRDTMAEVTSALQGLMLTQPFYFISVKGYSILTALGITTLIDLFIFVGYTYAKLRVHSNLDTLKGRTFWESAKELTKRYAETEVTEDFISGNKKNSAEYATNNVIMSKNFYVDLNTKRHFHALNTLLLGVSGSGKTRFWLKPNLMQMNCSFAITDPKGEVLDSCGELLRRNGYDVKIFDIVDKKDCNTYNPLKYCTRESDIRKIIEAFMKNTDPTGGSGSANKDPFWDDSTRAFLCACVGFLVMKPEGSDVPYAQIEEITGGTCFEACFANLCELTRMANRKWTPNCGITIAEGASLGDGKNNTANASELAAIFENLRAYEAKIQDCNLEDIEKPYCLREWENFRIAPEKTSTTILMTTAVKLDPFNIEEIKNLTSTDTINLDEIATKKTALFLIMPTTDKTYNFLLAFLYTQLFDTLYQFGEKKVDGSKTLKLQNGELVKWFSKEEVAAGGIDDVVKKIKNARIERVEINGKVEGFANDKKGGKKKITFDDAIFNIVSEDGELISRRPTKKLAEKYINDLQNVKLEKGKIPALPWHFRFLIDEFPNIGEIPEFKEKLSTMRGYEISAVVICQTITQLKGMYEKDYEVIDANCPFVVFLGGDENSNNEYLSKKIGSTTSVGSNNSIDNKKVNTSYQRDSQNLMAQEDIGRIPYENCLVFTYAEQPLYDNKPDVKEHRNYKLSREYFHDLGINAMEFQRKEYEFREVPQITWRGSKITAIPNVVMGSPKEFMAAMRSFLKAPTNSEAIEKANANIERYMFETESVAVAY